MFERRTASGVAALLRFPCFYFGSLPSLSSAFSGVLMDTCRIIHLRNGGIILILIHRIAVVVVVVVDDDGKEGQAGG